VWSAYLDASALAKRYVPEPGTARMNYLFRRLPPNRLVVLSGGVAEVLSILVRGRNAGRITAAQYAQAVLDFHREVIRGAVVKRTARLRLVVRALSLIQRHSINSTDAILLRSALGLASWARRRGDDFFLVTADRRLLTAARAEGLATFDPETQSDAELDALLGP
jgi:predicted nucleic acid-binding protein